MRSTVNVAIVPSTSAIGVEPVEFGRGGNWGSPVSGLRPPTNPNFQSSWRPAAVADRRRQVVGLGLFGHAEAALQRPDSAGVQAGDDHRVDVARLDAGRLEGFAPGLVAEGQVLGLAEALLPLLGTRIARRPPPL